MAKFNLIVFLGLSVLSASVSAKVLGEKELSFSMGNDSTQYENLKYSDLNLRYPITKNIDILSSFDTYDSSKTKDKIDTKEEGIGFSYNINNTDFSPFLFTKMGYIGREFHSGIYNVRLGFGGELRLSHNLDMMSSFALLTYPKTNADNATEFSTSLHYNVYEDISLTMGTMVTDYNSFRKNDITLMGGIKYNFDNFFK